MPKGRSLSELFGVLSFFAMPAIDVLFVIYIIYSFGASLFIAIPVGLVIGIFLCALFIIPQGTASVEVFVGSLILFIMLFIGQSKLHQMAGRARAKARATAMKAAVKPTPTQMPSSKSSPTFTPSIKPKQSQ